MDIETLCQKEQLTAFRELRLHLMVLKMTEIDLIKLAEKAVEKLKEKIKPLLLQNPARAVG